MVARDERVWAPIAQQFPVDRTLINLDYARASAAPRSVRDAHGRYLSFGHQAPAYTMWRILAPQRETVRARIARTWGVDAEEIAFTRNASESLEICQFGVDLAPGDEVLTTDQDYRRMIRTFQQRERREGIVLRQISLPPAAAGDAAVVEAFGAAITERTRLVLMCHVLSLTGRVLPVRRVVALARERGVPVIVDGAQAFAHLDFRLADLDCDYYATSLHKWLGAPHGTGLLYVRRSCIGDLWPLMAAPADMRDDIRKFEQIGTHPAADVLAVGEALAFHEAAGAARKEARLRWLRDLWVEALSDIERVRLRTDLTREHSCGIATVALEGMDGRSLARRLWREQRILVRPIDRGTLQGIRVSPSLATTPGELELFVGAMRALAEG